ncbi:sigma-70 family RNA polymerase sigma factor [Singulisphaera sp. PoT]|uniref:sigma-70 family RNA polymerase sigma factor n=1 Tax=Singulisphaera sp. PoT TaxID=3411797 RepID=UPI003BF5EE1D
MSTTLLERIARGDREAVPACLAAYGGLVWALARKYSADPAEAEDAAQEIFIDLWRHAGRFDPGVANEPTFVAMIARRRLIDRSRKRGRTVATTLLPEDGGPAHQAVDDRLAVEDEASLIRARMAEISPEQRMVLEMAIDRGMTQSDIATALAMPLGTVKAHARRGLLRLRELLAGSDAEPAREGYVR